MSGKQDTLYRQAEAEFAPAIARLAHAVERNEEIARDLEQDIHCELWRSFARFKGDCALSTWVYRVAHNVAADHVGRATRGPKPVPLEEIEDLPSPENAEDNAAANHAMGRIRELIHTLPLIDAQVILLWLEGQSGKDIAEITGLSVNAVGVRTHRIKGILAGAFEQSPETRPQTQPQPQNTGAANE